MRQYDLVNYSGETKAFDLGVILSVVKGRLLSPAGVEGVYDLLSFMTGQTIYQPQMKRALDVCGPALLNQYPALENIGTRNLIKTLENRRPGDDTAEDIVDNWGEAQKDKYFNTFRICKLQSGVYVADTSLDSEERSPGRPVVYRQPSKLGELLT